MPAQNLSTDGNAQPRYAACNRHSPRKGVYVEGQMREERLSGIFTSSSEDFWDDRKNANVQEQAPCPHGLQRTARERQHVQTWPAVTPQSKMQIEA